MFESNETVIGNPAVNINQKCGILKGEIVGNPRIKFGNRTVTRKDGCLMGDDMNILSDSKLQTPLESGIPVAKSWEVGQSVDLKSWSRSGGEVLCSSVVEEASKDSVVRISTGETSSDTKDKS